MATKNWSRVNIGHSLARLYRWEGLANGDHGRPLPVPDLSDKTVQIVGTFGTGGQVNFEGSVVEDAVVDADFVTLTDPQGNAIEATAVLLETVQENTLWVRPHVVSGDGDTNIDVLILVR